MIPEERRPRVVAYGGGLDSFAMLLDALARGEKPDVVCFCDVADPEGQDPGEWPGTYQHLREVVMPLCAREGIEFEWLDTLRYPVRDERSLFVWFEHRGQIPVAGPNRICTIIAKVERFERWLNDRWPGRDVEVWVGFEAGEERRAQNDPNTGGRRRRKPQPTDARRHNRFPLLERGLCRCRCEALVRASGHPMPWGSACMYCPYGTRGDWQLSARVAPEKFARTVRLEANKPPTSSGKKLSIMGFRSLKNRAGEKVGYKAPPLPTFILGRYKARPKPCAVCGAAQRAVKTMGCGFAAEARPSRPVQLPLFAVA